MTQISLDANDYLREVGTIRVDGVRFRVYAGDHDGSSVAHVHAMFDGGEVVIELFRDAP